MRKALWLLAVLALAGCGERKEEVAPTGGEMGAKPIRAAVVTDAAGIDDKSFNASAWEGLKRAEAELGAEKKYLESREQSDYATNLSRLAEQGNDLVFAVGYLMEDALAEVAPKHPNTKFAIIDGSAPDLPNCVSLKFREEEGCFLAGYLAGRMSKTGAIGFVGGMEGALITKFEVGYKAGALTANPGIRVLSKYVGNWTDVAKGKELALAEFADGADIIFHAAGKGGLGALDAAAEKGAGYYGIGVDADQDHIHPGRILTSMMKRVDNAVYDAVRALKEGQWRSGTLILGLKEGGIDLSPMKYTKQDVPPDALDKLAEIKQQIIDGKIKVPTTPEELQNFTPPKI